MAENNITISICICTYKRPGLLSTLLDEIGKLNIDDAFNVEVVIVDNDRLMTAAATVRERVDSSRFTMKYIVEGTRNISLARNAAVNNAKGDIIAFIDDDEMPDKDWLVNANKAYGRTGASGIIGPKVPIFPDNVPPYIKELRYFNRKRMDGQAVTENEFNTGNAFLDARIFKRDNIFFDTDFGLTGGEDIDLFLRAHKTGHRFVWSESAIVYEKYGPDRTRALWFLKRGLRIGKVYYLQHLRDIGLREKMVSLTRSTRDLAVGLVRLVFPLCRGDKSLVIDRLIEVAIPFGVLFGWSHIWKDEYGQ